MKNCELHKARQAVVIERMEGRVLLSGTQTITIAVPEGQGVTFATGVGTHIDVEFQHCSGTVTITGTDLTQTTVTNSGIVVTGQVTSFNQVAVTASSNPRLADVTVDGIGFDDNENDWEDLQDFVDSVRINKIQFKKVALSGDVQFDASQVILPFAHDARLSVLDVMTVFNFGTIADSTFLDDGPIGTVIGQSFYGTVAGLSSLRAQSIKNLSILSKTDYTNFDIPGGVSSFKLGAIDHSRFDVGTLRSSTFTGGSVLDSTFNFTGAAGMSLNLTLGGINDSFINDSGYLRNLKIGSMMESSSAAAGINANSINSFSVLGDYKADFKLTPSFGLKNSLGSLKIGGTALGNWDLGGTTHLLSAHTFDPSFSGTFGRIDTLNIPGTFSGTLSSGSIGSATIGNMTSGNLWLTNPWLSSSWDLKTLKVSHEILSSQIMSAGNIKSISTMFTYNSEIGAGLSPGFVFSPSNPPTLTLDTETGFSSMATISSFISDCPNKTAYHFSDSYVGAYTLGSIQIGNVQTQNSGLPEGLATTLVAKLQAGLKSGKINLKNIKSASDVSSALTAANITPADLGDLKFLLPNR